MDTHVSVAIISCVVTVHRPVHQGIGSIQMHIQNMKQSRYPVWSHNPFVIQIKLLVLVQMAVQISHPMAVQTMNGLR